MWAETLDLAKEGDFDAINPRIFITQLNNLQKIHKMYKHKAAPFLNPKEHTGVFIYGESGVGKSDGLALQYPGAFDKMLDKSFDDYGGEDIAIQNEVTPEYFKSHANIIKLFTNHLEFNAQMKYGTAKVHLKGYVMTSNWSFAECLSVVDMHDRQPLKNRFRILNLEGDFKQFGLGWMRPADFFSLENLRKIPLGREYSTDDYLTLIGADIQAVALQKFLLLSVSEQEAYLKAPDSRKL